MSLGLVLTLRRLFFVEAECGGRSMMPRGPISLQDQSLDLEVSRTSQVTVAIVHDYLTQRGGAERVVLAMADAFPGAPIHTALYEPGATFPEFADLDVRPLWTNRIVALRRDHRRGLPIYPIAFSSLKLDADVVLCSSSGFAHGVHVGASSLKIVYCHTPARWLYDQSDAYLAGWNPAIRVGARILRKPLRAWDRQRARSADATLANSTMIRESIQAAYDLDAEVVPPPAPVYDPGSTRAVPGLDPGFVLCVTRLLAYKNVDAVVRAFDALPHSTLVIVGEGPEREVIDELAGNNVWCLGGVSDAELHWLYANCLGLVSAAHEDFGLTPLEAASFGKPAVVLRYGGFLDSVVEGETGLFFDEPEPGDIAKAIDEMTTRTWDVGAITRRAALYSAPIFSRRLHEVIARAGAGNPQKRHVRLDG